MTMVMMRMVIMTRMRGVMMKRMTIRMNLMMMMLTVMMMMATGKEAPRTRALAAGTGLQCYTRLNFVALFFHVEENKIALMT